MNEPPDRIPHRFAMWETRWTPTGRCQLKANWYGALVLWVEEFHRPLNSAAVMRWRRAKKADLQFIEATREL